jgi:hypothetical protein
VTAETAPALIAPQPVSEVAPETTGDGTQAAPLVVTHPNHLEAARDVAQASRWPLLGRHVWRSHGQQASNIKQVPKFNSTTVARTFPDIPLHTTRPSPPVALGDQRSDHCWKK